MTTENSLDHRYRLEEKTNPFLPSISIDCTIFGFHNGILKILLNKFKANSKWMLPGGFVLLDENVNCAAHRLLSERTGLSEIYLKQFYLFGDTQRTNLEENKSILETVGISTPHWLLERFVSIGYYALVDYSKLKIYSSENEKTEWFQIDEIPQLYGDHNKIIDKAIKSIRSQITTVPIGYELLPEKFTMSDLRVIYETILDRKLDRRNFQRKMLATGYVVKLDEVSKKWGCKSATLFTFDKEKYNYAMKSGMAYNEW